MNQPSFHINETVQVVSDDMDLDEFSGDLFIVLGRACDSRGEHLYSVCCPESGICFDLPESELHPVETPALAELAAIQYLS